MLVESLIAVLGIAAMVAIGICLLLIYRKVRKIHLATYDLVAAGQETRALFAQIQALWALERKLGMADPLPPVRGWAGSPDFLLLIANKVSERKPKVIMECSSGVSTLVIARCLQMNGAGHVYSLEHDAKFAEATRQMLVKFGVESWATVLDAPLVTEGASTPWYRTSAIPSDLSEIDMLVIDGPPAYLAPMARYPALPVLFPRMARQSFVIVDDAARPDESRMIEKWRESFPEGTYLEHDCEKGCVTVEFGQRSQ